MPRNGVALAIDQFILDAAGVSRRLEAVSIRDSVPAMSKVALDARKDFELLIERHHSMPLNAGD